MRQQQEAMNPDIAHPLLVGFQVPPRMLQEQKSDN